MEQKGRLWLLLSMVLLLLSACAAVEAIAVSPVENHLEEMSTVVDEETVRWYRTEILSGEQEGFSYAILYPSFQSEEIDGILAAWASTQADHVQSIYRTRLEEGAGERGSLALYYNLVPLVEGQLYRIDLWGEGVLEGESDQEGYVMTDVNVSFYLDRTQHKLLELGELVDFSRAADIVRILRATYVDLYDWNPQDNDLWLRAATVDFDGMTVTLSHGESGITINYAIGQATLGNILSYGDYAREEAQLPTEEELPPLPTEVPEVFAVREIDPDLPMIALTFDDGPSRLTEDVLDILEKYGVRATFFMIGNLVDYYPETLKRMVELECEPANHTWDHKLALPKRSKDGIRDQIVRTMEKIEETTGIRPKWVRPPYGEIDDRVKEITAELDLYLVNWSVDTLDWLTKDTEAICAEVMKSTKDGRIILFHDLYETTVAAIEILIPQLLEQGYQLVTVSELFEYSDREIVAGNLYRYQ